MENLLWNACVQKNKSGGDEMAGFDVITQTIDDGFCSIDYLNPKNKKLNGFVGYL